jgi:hypothetical protein
MRFGGEDAVGVGISLRDDGNVARLGKNLKQTVASYQDELPVGVEIQTVSDQTKVVDDPSESSPARCSRRWSSCSSSTSCRSAGGPASSSHCASRWCWR